MQSSPRIKMLRVSGQRGFALVIALSLMAFVLLLLLSITTLVRVETQASHISSARVEAEQAALLGLSLALGDLQKAAGSDQRVTATADIVGSSAQPHLLGVWKSFSRSNGDSTSINYSNQKDTDFVQWLSSASLANKTLRSYPTSAPVSPIELIGDGTVVDITGPSEPSNFVSAEGIEIDTLNAIGGSAKYAWQVFDESQKANLRLSNGAVATSDAQRIATLGTGGKPGFRVDSAFVSLDGLSDAERAKLASLKSSNVRDFDPVVNSAFHYLTTDSKNLLVDVVNGGFQKDLSLLFENTTLPSLYEDRHIYSESNTPVVPAPSRFNGAEAIPSPDPKWSLLQSHYNLYKDVTTAGGAYGVDASYVERDDTTEYFDKQQLLPVVSNAQFIFSMASQRFDSLTTETPAYDGFLGLWTEVVVTLWNPYNVELRVPNMEFEFYRFPLQVEFFREGAGGVLESASSGQPVHISYMFSGGGSSGGNNPTGIVNIQDQLPYRARITNSIVLKPGEYKVFGPSSYTYNHKNWNYTRGLVLEEGWDPKGGGIFERYLAIDKDYNRLSYWPEGTRGSAQIKIKMGDVFSVRVSPSRLNRNAGIEETNGEEIVTYLKVFQGVGGTNNNVTDLDAFEADLNTTRKQVGAIEIDYSDERMNELLPTYEPSDMSQMVVNSAEFPSQGDSDFHDYKYPFLIASLRLKTELDSDVLDQSPSGRMWLQNGIANQYFSTGIPGDQSIDEEALHQYELTWEPMTSWSNIPSVEYNPDNNRGYGGSGVTSGTGVEFAPYYQIPLAPATSIAQFAHAHLNGGGQAPLTSLVVGNSFAPPLLALDSKEAAGSIGRYVDHSYMANTTLFDSYFLSTATEQTQAIFGNSRDLTTVINEFFDYTQDLPNPNFEPAVDVAPVVTTDDYDTFAQYLYNQGAFNVNSTSEEAWALFLASGSNEALPIIDLLTASTDLTDAANSLDSVVSRFAPMIGDEKDATTMDGQDRWQGHRRLNATEVETLAANVVAEVKARGPFQSIAEFVNRRLDTDNAVANSGALQTAIENSNLNSDFGLDAPRNDSELSSGSFSGNSSDGAATQITQADLLNRLAPSITVRGDTFRIRTYGEVTVGGETVKTWCEAVVQRGHDFIDNSQISTTDSALLNVVNQTYGRRFNVVSFRWLSESEI